MIVGVCEVLDDCLLNSEGIRRLDTCTVASAILASRFFVFRRQEFCAVHPGEFVSRVAHISFGLPFIRGNPLWLIFVHRVFTSVGSLNLVVCLAVFAQLASHLIGLPGHVTCAVHLVEFATRAI